MPHAKIPLLLTFYNTKLYLLLTDIETLLLILSFPAPPRDFLKFLSFFFLMSLWQPTFTEWGVILHLLKNGCIMWINYTSLDNYLDKLFGIILHGRFVISLYCFSHVFIHISMSSRVFILHIGTVMHFYFVATSLKYRCKQDHTSFKASRRGSFVVSPASNNLRYSLVWGRITPASASVFMWLFLSVSVSVFHLFL